jgi:hypothetical protein
MWPNFALKSGQQKAATGVEVGDGFLHTVTLS